MKVRYTEGHASVLLDEVGEVQRGETVEVSAETGKQLLEQGWEQVGGRKKTTHKKTTQETSSSTEAPAGEAASQGSDSKENE